MTVQHVYLSVNDKSSVKNAMPSVHQVIVLHRRHRSLASSSTIKNSWHGKSAWGIELVTLTKESRNQCGTEQAVSTVSFMRAQKTRRTNNYSDHKRGVRACHVDHHEGRLCHDATQFTGEESVVMIGSMPMDNFEHSLHSLLGIIKVI